MASRRKRGIEDAADPVFAAEMKALEAEHHAAFRERMNRPATATPSAGGIPGVRPSVLHVHDDRCWIDRDGNPVLEQEVRNSSGTYIVGKTCQRMMRFVPLRERGPVSAGQSAAPPR